MTEKMRLRWAEGFAEKIRQHGVLVTQRQGVPPPYASFIPSEEKALYHVHISLQGRKGLLGVMCLVGFGLRQFSPWELRVLQAIGYQVGMAIERALLYRDISESEARYRTLFESGADAVVVVDMEGRITGWNRAAETLYGWSREEVMGKRLGQDFPFYPKGKEGELDRFFEEIGKGRVISDYETTRLTREGQEIPVSLTVSPHYGPDGTLRGIFGLARDISERKRIQQELEKEREQLLAIFESFTEPIYVVDPESYEILYVNQALKKLFTTEAENIIGQKCYKLLQDSEGPCEFCTNDRIFGENLGKPYIWESYNRKVNRWFRCIDRAILWPDGRWVRHEVAIDITERKRVEEAIRKSEEKFRILAESCLLYTSPSPRD